MKKRKPAKHETKKYTDGGVVLHRDPVVLGERSLTVQSDPPANLTGTGLMVGQIPPHLYPLFVGTFMEG